MARTQEGRSRTLRLTRLFWGGGYDVGLGYADLRAIDDVNGDERPDIGTSVRLEVSGTAAVVIPSGRYSGRNEPLPERSLVLEGGEYENVGLVAPSTGDFDGDGLTDILTGSGYWGDHRGREYLVLGGNIPWEETSAW